VKLRRDKKARTTSPRGTSAPSRRSEPARQTTSQPRSYTSGGSEGLPGSAGYPEGPNTALPNFFNTRRPDGRTDSTPARRSKKFSR